MRSNLNTYKISDLKNIVFFTVVLSILIVIGGYVYFQYESNRIKANEFKQLDAIAKIKNEQISQWLNERAADAMHFSSSGLYVEAFEKWIQHRDVTLGNKLKKRNRMIRDLKGFKSVYIVTPERKAELKFDSIRNSQDTILAVYIDSVYKYKNCYYTDLYYSPNTKSVQLAIISPIINDNKTVVAAIVFIIDPGSYFFPFVQKWPTSSKTSEILLVKKDQNNIRVMNNIRHSFPKASKELFSINDTGELIVKAGLGKTGNYIGKDYRNIEVLADVRKITGTNWYMVTKVDKTEILSELRFRGIVVTIIILVLIIVIGLLIGWYYLYKKNSIYRSLLINELRVRKVEEEYRVTLYSVGDGVISIDTNGFIKKMNKEAERLTGWTENEAKGKPLEEVFKIDYEDEFHGVSDITDINQISHQFIDNSYIISKTGQKIPIDGKSSIIKNDKDDIIGIVIVFKDRSKERDAQRALLESENRLKRAEYISKSGNWEIHLRTRKVYASKGAQILYEIENEPWDMEFIQQLPLAEYRDKLNIAMRELVEKGEPYNVEFKIKQVKSGNIKDIQSVATYDPKEQKIFGVIKDITDFKRNESLLIEKDLIFNSLMEFSPIFIFFKDYEIRGHLSKNYEKMLGMPVSEAYGKTMDDLFPSDLAKSMIEDDKKILNDGKLIEIEEELNGRHYTTIKFPITREGMSPMLAGFTIDITDRKNAEKDIITARDKAERSDKLKDAFLQNMSHEIRTPMNAIIGFAELLQNMNIPYEKRNNYISIIVNSSNQLLAIVNDILTVSRIQMGQEVLNNSYTDINRLIAEISIIYRSKIESCGLSFVINNALNKENFVIQTDGTKLIQIISNLLNNSIKFTSKGFIEFSCMLENNLLKFSIKDSGIGIKPEMQTLIFERFMQAHYSISKNYGGTGLGLSICKAYAELLGGNIGVNSKPGSGSEFYFTIACNRVDPIQRMKVPQLTVEDNITKTILVAEDEIYNFQLIKEILSNKYILISAENGLEAVKKFKQYPEIDLILMDIKMPEMDGVTAMKEIKKIRSDVPVIAQTAYALDDEKQEFMKSGFNDYITKPLNRIELLSKVAQYLNMD